MTGKDKVMEKNGHAVMNGSSVTIDESPDIKTTDKSRADDKDKNLEIKPSDKSRADDKNKNLEIKPSDKSSADDRGEWGNKWEFILSCIGLSVGLGNVWRFPYLAYENGGAAFLIAYLILQILIGKPMYLLELSLGQYSGKGPTAVWAMNPSAKGIGIAMTLISLVVTIYYNVIMSYTLFYFFSSMQATLPWTVCKPEWLQYGCVEKTTKPLKYCDSPDRSPNVTECRCTLNATFDSELPFNCTNTSYSGEPTAVAEIFFYREVIEKSANLYPDDVGAPLWKLTLCLLLSWIIVVICLIRGIKTSGKVVYFTATFPYVILLILLVRGATLDGAIDGVIFFVVPKWEKLLDLKVWVAAAGQMFFSLSVSFGGIIMFGSYNKFKNNIYRDSLLISIMDVFTSILAGFVIFTTFGGMAKSIGVSVEDVAKGGYGLAFVAYPEALSSMPPPQLWSILFFFMLYNLGLSSEFGMLETVLTGIQDEFPQLRKYKAYMCVGCGVAFFLLGLPCVTPAGDYIVTMMDHYGADFSVLFVSSCECVAVIWVYGIKNFIGDMTYMLGRAPRPIYFWGFCWAFCSPVIIALLFIYRMAQYDPLKINKDEAYPQFAQAIGWVITILVICPIPITFLYQLYQAKGTLMERLKIITTPTSEWGPNDKEALTENVKDDHFSTPSKTLSESDDRLKIITTPTSEWGPNDKTEKEKLTGIMNGDHLQGIDNPSFTNFSTPLKTLSEYDDKPTPKSREYDTIEELKQTDYGEDDTKQGIDSKVFTTYL